MKMINKNNNLDISQLPDVDILKHELARLRYRDRYIKTLKNTIFTLITVSAMAVLVATIWLPVLQIYGNSMTPTLKSGNIVVSINDKRLKRGDIIAFYYNNKVLVKRVIATSGQWIDIKKNGTVYVNGKIIKEHYLSQGEKAFGEINIKLPYQVPEGKYFVMGDHRKVSLDSRNKAIGTVSEEQLVGKLTFRIWPLNKFGSIR